MALLRGVHLAALLSLFGTLLFAVVVAPARPRQAPPKRPDCDAAPARSRAPARCVRCLPGWHG